MALPGDVTTFTLTFGPYTNGQGSAALVGTAGKLFPVDPSTNRRVKVLHPASGAVIVPADVAVTVLDDGTATVAGIPHTGQSSLSPSGWAWRVEWSLPSNNPSHPGNKTFVVVSGATVDYDQLVAADTVPPVAISLPNVTSVAGLTGAPTSAQLVTAMGTDLDAAYATDAALTAGLAGKQDTATLDTAVAAKVDDPASAASVALRAAFGRGGREVVLPSGARVTPLPGALSNEWRYNADTFIQDNVTTVDTDQYAVWVNESFNPVIGKRKVGSDTWTTFDLSTIPGNPLVAPVQGDGHNVYVVAVDSAGFIHVAGDMHAHPLHYVRSTAAGEITGWEAPGMVGTDEDRVSYPQFARTPVGELLFIYRETAAVEDPDPRGYTVINAYNATTKAWARRSVPLSGTGFDSGPYTNRVAFGADGSMHLFYMWRDSGAGMNDTAIGHIRSADSGVTWTQMGSATPATLPITKATHVAVATVAANNQQGADVDSNGNPHAAFMSNKGNALAIRHVYWSGSAWVTEDVVNHSIEPGSLVLSPRVNLFCRGADTYLIYSLAQTGAAGGGVRSVRLRNLSTADRHVDFPLIEANLGQWEPSFDARALRDRDELVMLVTPVQSETASLAGVDLPKHMRAGGGILTYPLTALRLSAVLADGPVMNERLWIPARDFFAVEGSPTLGLRGSVPAWTLADAAISSVAAVVSVPQRWQGYNLEVWWAGAGASGSVSFTTRTDKVRPGSAVDTIPTGTWWSATATAAAGAAGVAVVSLSQSARPNVVYDVDHLTKVTVTRSGAVGGDTLAGDALLLGVMLSPTLIP